MIDTFEAEVVDGGVTAVWRYDYAADDARAAEQGEARFIAELAAEDGAAWAKTLEPVTVTLKSLGGVDWDRERAELGTEVELVADAFGFSDGATATMIVQRLNARGTGELIDTLEAVPIVDQRICTTWTTPDSEMECYFEIEIDDGIERVAVSDILSVGD